VSHISRWLRVGVSIGLALALLFLFARKLDFEKVGEAIGSADRWALAAAVLLSLLGIPIRSWRWTRLLKHVGDVRQWDAIAANCIGFAATTLLPARAGEVVRPVALARMTRLPTAPLLASIGLERLLDLVSVLVLFVFYALGGWAPTGMAADEGFRFALLRRSAFLVGAGTIAALTVLAALATFPESRERFLLRLLGFLPERLRGRVHPILSGFLKGFDAIRSGTDLAAIGVGSALLWLSISLQCHVTLRAFGVVHPFPVAFFVLTWAILGLAVPTPGGVGGYHKSVAYALTGFYGVTATSAGAFALVSHLISFVPVTLLGLLFLGTTGLRFGQLSAEAGEVVNSGRDFPA
jgi:uncharacterized protein (TIRG00374 family)